VLNIIKLARENCCPLCAVVTSPCFSLFLQKKKTNFEFSVPGQSQKGQSRLWMVTGWQTSGGGSVQTVFSCVWWYHWHWDCTEILNGIKMTSFLGSLILHVLLQSGFVKILHQSSVCSPISYWNVWPIMKRRTTTMPTDTEQAKNPLAKMQQLVSSIPIKNCFPD